MSVLFISGIDTDIGKTYVTGLLAKAILERNGSVITQKLVQTGCTALSEDILKHRDIMGIPLQAVDKDGTTCPYIFPKPASPHLSSALVNQSINPEVIHKATQQLQSQYNWVLLEGAGGLMVPINKDLLTIDYIAHQRYPVILVTSGRLGSISHTLLSLEALRHRSIPLQALVYNHWQSDKDTRDSQIEADTKAYFQSYLKSHHPDAHWVELPDLGGAILDSTLDSTDANLSPTLTNYIERLLSKK